MKIPRHIPACMIASGAVFLLIDFFLVVGGLLEPSFAIVKIAYDFNTVVAPAVFLAVAVFGLLLWRKQRPASLLFWVSIAFIFLGIGLIGVRIYATYIEPGRLAVREVTFKSSKIEKPLRILHISDIQSGGIGPYEREVFRRMQTLRPDIILFTGDLLQPVPPARFGTELPKIASLFQELHPPFGIYGVYGDADGRLRRLPADALGGLHLLRNSEAFLQWGNTRIALLALSNHSSHKPGEAATLIRSLLEESNPTDLTILLGHSPDYAVSALDFPLDLCLAGHTHGGQIRIPFFGPLVTSTEYIPRSWALGYREIGKTRLNVSGGIGCEHSNHLPCIRFDCPPEMTLIVIEPK